MHNCADDVIAYHDDEVTLPTPERTEMRNRRNTNRNRLKNGLKKAEKPAPKQFKSQGSYAMRTMTQDSDKHYDIDDGAYFDADQLVGDRGAEMSALAARQMVRDAVDDGSFKTAPEVRPNCVRVLYDAGYHVDLPVYRKVETEDGNGKKVEHYELAGPDWRRSDARDVTTWLEGENTQQSPDADNGGQLRRITRELKKFSKSRAGWQGKTLSGFGITVLVTECYKANASREDSSLYDTMEAIKARLDSNLVIDHPVTPNETITNGTDDARARHFRDRLGEALDWLSPLFEDSCDREKALKCWDKVFSTKFFSGRLKKSEGSGAKSAVSGVALKEAADSADARGAVRKEGGGRYA